MKRQTKQNAIKVLDNVLLPDIKRAWTQIKNEQDHLFKRLLDLMDRRDEIIIKEIINYLKSFNHK